MTMLDDFIIRAALAGIGLSLATGPLGAFIVWRRMAYFSDTVAHAAILGVALSFAAAVPVMLGTFLVAIAIGFLAAGLTRKGRAMDTTLGVLAHSFLALGLVAISLVNGVRIDLNAFLFGDILTVGKTHLALIWGGSALVLAGLIWRWSPLLTATVNTELAASAGIQPRRENLALTLGLALVVALSLKVVGALLIGALLIIPAAAARGFSNTPERMAILAGLIGAVASIGGVAASVRFDAPTGASIVVVAAFVFVISLFRLRLLGRT